MSDPPLAGATSSVQTVTPLASDELKLPPSASASDRTDSANDDAAEASLTPSSTPVAGGRSLDGSSGWSSTVTATVPSNQGAMSLV